MRRIDASYEGNPGSDHMDRLISAPLFAASCLVGMLLLEQA
jgi:hypothetical protein